MIIIIIINVLCELSLWILKKTQINMDNPRDHKYKVSNEYKPQNEVISKSPSLTSYRDGSRAIKMWGRG